jgi:hypothetical protein
LFDFYNLKKEEIDQVSDLNPAQIETSKFKSKKDSIHFPFWEDP